MITRHADFYLKPKDFKELDVKIANLQNQGLITMIDETQVDGNLLRLYANDGKTKLDQPYLYKYVIIAKLEDQFRTSVEKRGTYQVTFTNSRTAVKSYINLRQHICREKHVDVRSVADMADVDIFEQAHDFELEWKNS